MVRPNPTRKQPQDKTRRQREPTHPTSSQLKSDPGLTPGQEAFIHEYDGNGRNGTRAYLATHPNCRSGNAAAVEAWRYLRIPKIKERIDSLAAARWKRLAMDGDEALARVAGDARADLRRLFDENGELLPVHEWPDSVAQSVKAIRPGPFGTTVVLNDSLAARRIIIEQTSKLKSTGGSLDALAEAIRADLEAHKSVALDPTALRACCRDKLYSRPRSLAVPRSRKKQANEGRREGWSSAIGKNVQK